MKEVTDCLCGKAPEMSKVKDTIFNSTYYEYFCHDCGETSGAWLHKEDAQKVWNSRMEQAADRQRARSSATLSRYGAREAAGS